MDSSPNALSLNLSSDLNKEKDCHARTVFDFSLLRKETEIPIEFIWPGCVRPNAVEEFKVPVVDIQGFLQGDEPSTRQAAEMVRAACSTYGCFQVINHGIDPSLSHDAMSFLEEFFQLPSDAKLRIHRQPGSFWGYTVAHLDRTSSKLPWREMLSLGNHSVASENGIVDYFKSISGKDFEPMGWVYHRYLREVKELSLRILEILAIGLGLDQEYFREFFKDGELNVRCLSYPPCQKPEEVLGIGPHCDPSALTVLQQDQVEGFEVFVEGKWQRVCPRPEALVINTGEIFMISSHFRSD
ncbi:gibberellin 20 oxidase 2-like [Cocos nucifera]|uniref:Gibberellin 20 oxidase 2-like n=1 Tax=Cocos nucifera TaxID=13894 RepID=A0A8K0IWT7_COCNU|nr:gibberellin 20 oxidase 2-like [Cocos nucifera]